MKNIRLKFKVLERRKELIDSYVWEIFGKYIKDKRINFNSPDYWYVEYDQINFVGSDGCRGCYDAMSLSIPIDFFEDYNKAMGIDLEKEAVDTAKKLKELADRQTQAEIAQLVKLKEKYPGVV